MIKTETLNINGTDFRGVCIQAPGGQGHPNMLVIVGKKGYAMCGYLNMDAAEKFQDAACIISGSDFDEMLANPVKAVSAAGEGLGIRVGMTGRQACELLA